MSAKTGRKRRFTEAEEQAIRDKKASENTPIQVLAKEYETSRSVIWRILNSK